MILRALLNLANGYEPNYSKLTSDRATEYKTLQLEKISDL